MINELLENGLIHITNHFSNHDINICLDLYNKGWFEIKSEWHNLIWYKRTYKPSSKNNFPFIGTDLYHDKKIAYYKDTMIIDMNNGRYDFTYNLDLNIFNQTLQTLFNSILECEYSHYYGGLPVENIKKQNENQNGLWHRDAYSLFNNDDIDINLPPFYYTILIPLEDFDYPTTEFILKSHTLSLSRHNIINQETLCNFIDHQCEMNKNFTIKPILKKGDMCIFHGYVLHRGLSIHSSSDRKMLYMVVKKNWYDDEPIINYTETLGL
jgi:hypothetical protein